MQTLPLLIATGCYIWTSVALFIKGDAPHGMTFFFYAMANIGLMWATWH